MSKMIKQIELRNGEFTIVDHDAPAWVFDVKWSKHNAGYAAIHRKKEGKTITTLLHRVIADCPDGMQVDHINGDKLDNRRDNLRVCTNQQNGSWGNSKVFGKSRFRGVSWCNSTNKWQVTISHHNKPYRIGRFDTEEEAARAYDRAAIILNGEYARTNKKLGLL